MLKKGIKLSYFVLLISFINLLFFHLPFYRFILNNTDASTLHGIFLLLVLSVLAFALSLLFFYVGLFLLRVVGKFLLMLLFMVNSVALYFMNTYSTIMDKTMIGNILNTNVAESSSFFSFTLVVYFILLGIIPALLIFKVKIVAVKIKTFMLHLVLILGLIFSVAYAGSSHWLWIDKHAKTLGGLLLPWSYIINTSRFYYHQNQENKEQILLPDAQLKNNTKAVFVLVIGESARSKNFSLLGYAKKTNPQLSNTPNVYSYSNKACATYTTAGVKCILEHKDSSALYEILPNYLYRNGIEVIWRTTNWGEPPVRIKNYHGKSDLQAHCQGIGCDYDEVLLSGLKEQILASNKSKILVILHTSTSHGPTYFKKYPPKFEHFTPVCTSVELAKCTQEELLNAYDNTILYTDHILVMLIKQLQQLQGYRTAMLYVSDHGESLGENNLYMHGIPASIAPKEQLEIPFILWSSVADKPVKENTAVSQHVVFHSVLDFLDIQSPVYSQKMSLFKH